MDYGFTITAKGLLADVITKVDAQFTAEMAKHVANAAAAGDDYDVAPMTAMAAGLATVLQAWCGVGAGADAAVDVVISGKTGSVQVTELGIMARTYAFSQTEMTRQGTEHQSA